MSAAGIGALRELLVLEQAVRTGDGGGGATVAWEMVAEIWAAVAAISGDERLAADQVAGRLTHTVRIRARTGVVPAMRFRQGTRVFHIVAVLEEQRRTRLKCLCEERFL